MRHGNAQAVKQAGRHEGQQPGWAPMNTPPTACAQRAVRARSPPPWRARRAHRCHQKQLPAPSAWACGCCRRVRAGAAVMSTLCVVHTTRPLQGDPATATNAPVPHARPGWASKQALCASEHHDFVMGSAECGPAAVLCCLMRNARRLLTQPAGEWASSGGRRA